MIFRLLLVVYCCFSLIAAQAQLCTGSLGDPIVNITFGKGSNPGTPLQAAGVGYTFMNGDCPNDGSYTIRNSTSNCFDGSWHQITQDHTGDGNGYFMLVNASYDPGVFYLDTVKGLCSGTTYEFAAWVMNVLKLNACTPNPMRPNLTFTIEDKQGQILGKHETNDIYSTANPEWKQYGFYFKTPVGVTDVVLRIVNNAPGGCGNDIALDDITFRPCGPQLIPSIQGTTNTILQLCKGVAVHHTISCTLSDGYDNPVFHWQKSNNGTNWEDIPNSNDLTLAVNLPSTTVAGSYYYRLTVSEAGNENSPQCNINSPSLVFVVNENPTVHIQTNSPICERQEILLEAAGGTSYSWTANGSNYNGATIRIPNASLSHAGAYKVVVSDNNGCTSEQITMIEVNEKPKLVVNTPDVLLCRGEQKYLSASGGDYYEWTPSLGLSDASSPTPIVSIDQNMDYTVVAVSENGCRDSGAVSVKIVELPIVNAGEDQIIFKPETQLQGTVMGDYQNVYWMPSPGMGDVNNLVTMVYPTTETTYRLVAEAVNGCGTVSDDVIIRFYNGIYIPSAFSPNGDGINDTWYIPMLDAFPQFELRVYNRHGQVVFINKGLHTPWNGMHKSLEQPIGTYVYQILLNDEAKTVLKGTVTIIR